MTESARIAPATHSAGALRTYFNIVSEWRLADDDARALLGVAKTTFNRWRDNPEKARLSPDQFERLSYVFGIYKDLQILFSDRETADGWMNRPNDAPLFGGRPPMTRFRRGLVADLFLARAYLNQAIQVRIPAQREQ